MNNMGLKQVHEIFYMYTNIYRTVPKGVTAVGDQGKRKEGRKDSQ
jgi:hypothetical protein